eukprot:3583044-Rhodomonas_salina.1
MTCPEPRNEAQIVKMRRTWERERSAKADTDREGGRHRDTDTDTDTDTDRGREGGRQRQTDRASGREGGADRQDAPHLGARAQREEVWQRHRDTHGGRTTHTDNMIEKHTHSVQTRDLALSHARRPGRTSRGTSRKAPSPTKWPTSSQVHREINAKKHSLSTN